MIDTSTFIFQGWETKNQEIHFRYTLKHGEKEYNFTEKLLLPEAVDFTTIPQKLLTSLLNNLLLILGISYWKLYCPKTIKIASFSLSSEQAVFWNTVYTKGLGEFFYENNIDYRGLVVFPYEQDKNPETPVAFPRKNRSLLPLGGGKDSIVAGELLKKLGKPFSIATFYTGLTHSIAQEQVVKKMNIDNFLVKRTLDPQLFVLNKQADAYNGHIPAVAIHSFVSVFLAALYDFRSVIFANEESASYGNIEYLGEIVNHQWSKSWEFEKLFADYIRDNVTPDILYFSLLRPFSEIHIAKIFSEHKEYFPLFVSCNRGYAMSQKGNTSWCGQCPKCAFVFALLSGFVSKPELIEIFHKDLFDDMSLIPLYRELLGLDGAKPFECVGTPAEVRLALYYAYKKKEWEKSALMQLFIHDILSHMAQVGEQEIQLFSLKTHQIPKEFSEILQISQGD